MELPNDKIFDFKWNPFSNHLIEIETENQEFQLIDIKTKKIIAKYKNIYFVDFLFLNENSLNSLLLFKTHSIQIIDIKESKIKNQININCKYIINIDLIPYNYFIVIREISFLKKLAF